MKKNRVKKFPTLRKRWKQKRRVNELLRTERGVQRHRIEAVQVITALKVFVKSGRSGPFCKTILAKRRVFGLKYMDLKNL